MAKIKVLVYELEDGRKYYIQRRIVANDRATHYAKIDKDTTFQEEYDYIMSDEGEDCMWDWVKNNMDWYDHKPVQLESGSFCDLGDAEVEDSYVDEIEEVSSGVILLTDPINPSSQENNDTYTSNDSLD